MAGAPLASTGIPRELKTIQAVFSIACPAASRHGGAWAIAACVLGGGAATGPNPYTVVVDRYVVPPCVTHAGTPVDRHVSTRWVLAIRSTYKRACVKFAAACIRDSDTSFLIPRASPINRRLPSEVLTAIAVTTPTTPTTTSISIIE